MPSRTLSINESILRRIAKRAQPDFSNISSKDNYGLQIHAYLNHNTALMSCNSMDFQWHIKIRCKFCRKHSEPWQHFSRTDIVEVSGGRGLVNFQEGCECGMDMRIVILPDGFDDYLREDNMNPKTVAMLECTNCEPTEFLFGGDWIVKSRNGVIYNNVDLTEHDGNWSTLENSQVIQIQGAWFYYFHLMGDWYMYL